MFAATQLFLAKTGYKHNFAENTGARTGSILDPIPGELNGACRLASYIRSIEDPVLSDHLMTSFSILSGTDLSQENVLDMSAMDETKSSDDANNLGAITYPMLESFTNRELPAGMIVIPVNRHVTGHGYPLGVPFVLSQTTDAGELYPEQDHNIGFDEREAVHFSEIRPASQEEASCYVEDRFFSDEAETQTPDVEVESAQSSETRGSEQTLEDAISKLFGQIFDQSKPDSNLFSPDVGEDDDDEDDSSETDQVPEPFFASVTPEDMQALDGFINLLKYADTLGSKTK